MNKLFRNAAILAFGFGMAMTFTACHSSDAAESDRGELKVVNKLIVKSNVAAEFEFAGVTKTGTAVEFSDISNGTLKVKKIGGVDVASAGYIAATYADVNVKFDNSNVVNVTYNFLKGLTTATLPTVSAAQATSGLVQPAETSSVVGGSIEIPAGSEALAGEKVGITYYTPVVTEDNTPDGTKKKKSFVSATAEPKNKTTASGKEFVITANIPGGQGCEIVASNGTNEVTATATATQISAKVPNLNEDWTFQLVATGVKKSTGESTVYSGTANGKEMKGIQNVGYTPGASIQNNTLLNMYLTSMFGEPGTTEVVEENPTSLPVTFVVNQEYTDYEFTSGSVTFTCRVWGKATLVYNTEGEVIVHSGGSSL